jgi:hypothetical protein
MEDKLANQFRPSLFFCLHFVNWAVSTVSRKNNSENAICDTPTFIKTIQGQYQKNLIRVSSSRGSLYIVSPIPDIKSWKLIQSA